jgi:hypothetical protein
LQSRPASQPQATAQQCDDPEGTAGARHSLEASFQIHAQQGPESVIASVLSSSAHVSACAWEMLPQALDCRAAGSQGAEGESFVSSAIWSVLWLVYWSAYWLAYWSALV